MTVILADDFSGAAELAGIAAARGFKAEVQTVFDPRSEAGVIAVDTDTRWRTEAEAARVVRALTHQVTAAKPAWIYKKTDSVMRGHLRAEIEAVLDSAALKDCVLIPANPSKGRRIQAGRYLVEGVPLHETVFAHDPDHPRHTDEVRGLLGDCSRIRTPDALALEDLPRHLPPDSLAAGAADFFSALLDGGLGLVPGKTLETGLPQSRVAHPRQRCLLLCGSLAAWETGRAAQMRQRGFEVKTIDEAVPPSIWQNTTQVMLAIGSTTKADAASLTDKLIEKALPLLLEPQTLRIGLEGGATAIAFIRRMGWTRFDVLAEGHTGVGALRPPGGPVLCVKPGSYPWPAETFV